MRKIYDSIRHLWTHDFPEEQLRQSLLQYMTEKLGYPRSLLSIEREVPKYLSKKNFRRADILCYRQDPKEGLVPLLLIECKATHIDPKAIDQVRGYNYSIRAPFFCLAAKKGIYTFWQEQDKLCSVDFLPSYQELLKQVEDVSRVN